MSSEGYNALIYSTLVPEYPEGLKDFQSHHIIFFPLPGNSSRASRSKLNLTIDSVILDAREKVQNRRRAAESWSRSAHSTELSRNSGDKL